MLCCLMTSGSSVSYESIYMCMCPKYFIILHFSALQIIILIMMLICNIYITGLFRLTWVSVSGTKYKTGAVVQTGFHNLLPVFAIARKIILVGGDPSKLMFIVEVIDTVCFSEHYHAYEVQMSEKGYEIYSQDEFVTYLPMNITSPVNGIGLYVNVKYDTDLMNLF